MIRVIYRWKVKEDDIANFQEVWSRTTNHIHETVAGAFMRLWRERWEALCFVAQKIRLKF